MKSSTTRAHEATSDAADGVVRTARSSEPARRVCRVNAGVYAEHGLFVCFEGGEGAGKSTQSRLLRDWLVERGQAVLLTFEPGDTEVGKELRRIVLDPATGELSDRTEALLYAADKAEHVDHVVLPALARGEVVITDRYVDSTLAYQGAGRTLDVAEVEAVARWATGDLRPHLTVVLDLEPAGRARPVHRARPDRGAVAGVPPARAAGLPRPGRRRPRPLRRARRAGPDRRDRRRDPGAGRAPPGARVTTPTSPATRTGLGRPRRPAPDDRGPPAGRHRGHGMTHAWLFTGPPGSGRSNVARRVRGGAAVRAADRVRRVRGVPPRHHGSTPTSRGVKSETSVLYVNEIRDLVQRRRCRPATGAGRSW